MRWFGSIERLKSDVEKSERRREYGDRPYDELRVMIGELTELRALEGLQDCENLSINTNKYEQALNYRKLF